jgi:coenzyme F420-reducing hydrogenase delta subunit
MGRNNNINWTLNQIIQFLHFQKERVQHKEITASTLKNFVKSLKVFCESYADAIQKALLLILLLQSLVCH